jgi:endonuclease YncB( thermonuclease family)
MHRPVTLLAALALFALPASAETIAGRASVIDGDTIDLRGAHPHTLLTSKQFSTLTKIASVLILLFGFLLDLLAS